MGMFNIQAASKLSGVGIHTLRAWERRYSVVEPARSDSGRRLYSDEDIEKLRLLNDLCNAGNSIGNLAPLGLDQLRELAKKFEHRSVRSDYGKSSELSVRTQDDSIATQSSLSGLLMALEQFKLEVIAYEIEKLSLNLTPRAFAFEIMLPLLQEVGIRVKNGTLTIAQEHALSSILRFHVGNLLFKNYVTRKKNPAVAILSTTEGDYHEFGILMGALLCVQHNIKFYYLGPNMPVDALLDASKALSANYIIVGTTDIQHRGLGTNLNKYFEFVLENLGKDQQLIVGGEVTYNLEKLSRNRKFKFMANLRILDDFLKAI
jgi:DNA-binding transcriptional MerR regulator